MNIFLILLFGVVIKLPAVITLFNILSDNKQSAESAASKMKNNVNYFDFFLWFISFAFWVGVFYLGKLIFS